MNTPIGKLFDKRKAFTLVELMVVVVIIGVLTAIAVPIYSVMTAEGEVTVCKANQRAIESAAVQYCASGNIQMYTVDDVDTLITARLLVEVPKCPCGGVYTLTDGVCDCNIPGHD